ncbi:hypothetical protein PsorP6_011573 [Peronosclerospora sorghi]|uniref:Uncharacterized protein n=1 Tax=Peronosclerospora sorghi TaxID=230839 RepID=A0ACC0WL82_9STRA|nr:hypothetical protein PsorP6_011573 [Peronosclerospora sorghi]
MRQLGQVIKRCKFTSTIFVVRLQTSTRTKWQRIGINFINVMPPTFIRIDIIYTWSLKISASSPSETLLEVGCGVGNAALPLLANNPALRIVAIDFAESAIELLKNQPLYDEARVAASVCDITQDPLPDAAFANGGVDFALFFFCLSALHPDKMKVQ